jgi:hypothetical protein
MVASVEVHQLQFAAPAGLAGVHAASRASGLPAPRQLSVARSTAMPGM